MLADLQIQQHQVQITAPEYFSNVSELINLSTLLKVRVDIGKSLVVDQTHPVLVSGKLVLQKTMDLQGTRAGECSITRIVFGPES